MTGRKKRSTTNQCVCVHAISWFVCQFPRYFPRCATLHSIFVQVWAEHLYPLRYTFVLLFLPFLFSFSPLFSTQFPSIVICVACFYTKVGACNFRERRSFHEPFITDVIDCLHCVRPLPAAFCHFSCATAHFPHTGFAPPHAQSASSSTTESVCKQ